ncbi:MAG: galactose mutarotase [Phycisphaerae bacterium]|nr:galactose mutarotase [Phycisphaerae bacterium]
MHGSLRIPKAWMLVVGLAAACGPAFAGVPKPAKPLASVEKHLWGRSPDGREVHLFTLANRNGATMQVTDYGCIVVSLTAVDRNGRFADIVLGYDRLQDYLEATPYFGAVVGRCGNRIANGKFTLDGKTYSLATNNEPGGVPCHLHGGKVGFDKVVWDADAVIKDGAVGVRFHHVSRDKEEGYPGNLDVTMHYWLSDENELRIEYDATSDQATPVNLTHHSYFNLDGHDSGTILNHELMIAADHITPVDKGLIPTGELMAVGETPFDFRQPTAIGKRVNADHEQLKYGLGYDHNFVLSHWDGKLRLAATVYEPRSGRFMEVLTTEPGVQFYCGNFLDGSNVGKGGYAYQHRTGFCLETQHFPDSPNKPAFPSTILRPGEEYRHTTVYRFSAK